MSVLRIMLQLQGIFRVPQSMFSVHIQICFHINFLGKEIMTFAADVCIFTPVFNEEKLSCESDPLFCDNWTKIINKFV